MSVLALTAAAAAPAAEVVSTSSPEAVATADVVSIRDEMEEDTRTRREAVLGDLTEQRRATAAAATRSRARTALKKQQELRAWASPLQDYTMTSGFGPRWGRQHEGLDLAAPTGTRVSALTSGRVVFAGYQGAFGNKVEVKHWDGTVSFYAHMSSIAVTIGQQLAPGDAVGEVGSTGRSTGPHLHLQVVRAGLPVDARRWLDDRGVTI